MDGIQSAPTTISWIHIEDAEQENRQSVHRAIEYIRPNKIDATPVMTLFTRTDVNDDTVFSKCIIATVSD